MIPPFSSSSHRPLKVHKSPTGKVNKDHDLKPSSNDGGDDPSGHDDKDDGGDSKETTSASPSLPLLTKPAGQQQRNKDTKIAPKPLLRTKEISVQVKESRSLVFCQAHK